jgi:methylene-tetrahydromethanopterin dehydrogenase
MLLDTLYEQSAEVGKYKAQSLEEHLLKAQILVALIEAGMRDVYPDLAKSVLDDARYFCGDGRRVPAVADLRPRQAPASPEARAPGTDAGNIVPDIHVTLKEVTSLVDEMMETARKAMVPPSQLTLFADPVGAISTAAAMVACVERVLRPTHAGSWSGRRVAVFGATGMVGFVAAIIAALEGAQIQLVAHRRIERLIDAVKISKERFGVELEPISGETEEAKTQVVEIAEVIFSAAAAGVRVISANHLASARELLVVADVNAVPPSGVEGIEPFMDGAPVSGSNALGIGPLTIANIKHRTESRLLMQVMASREPLSLNLRDMLLLARRLTR